MATYTPTITTTAVQDKGFALELVRVNADRAKQNPPLTPLASVGAMLLDKLNTILAESELIYLRELRKRFGAAINEATPSQLTDAAADLGVTLP